MVLHTSLKASFFRNVTFYKGFGLDSFGKSQYFCFFPIYMKVKMKLRVGFRNENPCKYFSNSKNQRWWLMFKLKNVVSLHLNKHSL